MKKEQARGWLQEVLLSLGAKEAPFLGPTIDLTCRYKPGFHFGTSVTQWARQYIVRGYLREILKCSATETLRAVGSSWWYDPAQR
jgi:hypothetical protein